MEKATFRAMREACGMTQSDVACEFDVDVRTVKRWENPKAQPGVPHDAEAWMSEAYADMLMRASTIAATILETRAGGDKVSLPYFRTQEDLDAVQLPLGQDQPVGYFNATIRSIMTMLNMRGIRAYAVYDDADLVPFDDLILDRMMGDE